MIWQQVFLRISAFSWAALVFFPLSCPHKFTQLPPFIVRLYEHVLCSKYFVLPARGAVGAIEL